MFKFEEIERKVINFLKANGPSLPIEISKALGMSTFFLNPFLDELVKNGKLKKSFKKIGSSSLYYLEGQENRVREKLLPYLKYQEKLVIERFRNEKVLKRDELSPMERFLLKDLYDFIIPYKVKRGKETLEFFAIYNLSENDVKKIVAERYFGVKEKKEEVEDTKEELEESKKAKNVIEEKIREVEKEGKAIKESEEIAKEENIIEASLLRFREATKEIEEEIKEGMEGVEEVEKEFKKEKEVIEKPVKKVKDVVKRKGKLTLEDFVKEVNGKIVEFIENRKNCKIAIVQYNVGPLIEKKIIFDVKKKNLTLSDIAKFYLEVSKRKIPGIIFCNGKVSEKVKKEVFQFRSFLYLFTSH